MEDSKGNSPGWHQKQSVLGRKREAGTMVLLVEGNSFSFTFHAWGSGVRKMGENETFMSRYRKKFHPAEVFGGRNPGGG